MNFQYNKLRLALVYDQLTKWGGAEQLINNLIPLLPPQTVIFTPKLKNKRRIIFNSKEIETSFLSSFPFKFLPYQLHLNLSQLVIENFNFNNFDLVLSLGNTLAKGVITNSKTRHLHYAFTTNRFLWQDYQLFKKHLPFYLRPLFSRWASNYRFWDYLASQRADKIITLSSYSQQLIKKYYHRPAEVVYPPFSLNYWLTLPSHKIKIPYQKFFLLVGRLVPQKRIEIAIRAAISTQTNLIIVGKGWLKRHLETLSTNHPNILFLTDITFNQLKYLYQKSQALIAPQEEDFGFIFLEAAAFYTPILSYFQGGQRDILNSYPQTYFFSSLTQLISLLNKFSSSSRLINQWPEKSKMERFYLPFQKETFQVKLKEIITQLFKERSER